MIDRLASAVVHFLLVQSVYVLVLFPIVAFFTWLLRHRFAYVRLGLWSLIFIRLVLPLDFSHAWSVRHLIEKVVHLQRFEQSSSIWGDQVKDPVLDYPSVHPWKATVSPRNTVIVLAWLIGVISTLAILVARRRYWRRLARSASRCRSQSFLSILDEWQQRLKVKRKIQLSISSHINTPFTMGLVRPIIILPKTLHRFDKNQIESILAHELVHIKRFDDWWIILQNILQCLFFFHPAVWFANHYIYVARECICDSKVLAEKVISPHTYSRGLVTLLKSTFDGLIIRPAFFGSSKVATIRIRHIVKGYGMKTPNVLKLLLFVLAMSLLPMAKGSNPSRMIDNRSSLVGEHSTLSFQNPLPPGSYHLTSGYGERRHPISGKIMFHRAVDLAAPTGTPVYAAASGIVTETITEHESGVGSGKVIRIEHKDGYITRYTQLDKILVKENQTVEKGCIIGHVGSSGLSTGPHLHFEIWKDGNHLNPQDMITF